MVVLIGGPGCVGKTKLAGRLAAEYGYFAFSLDHLKMGLIRGLPDCGFTAESDDRLITAKLWPIVRGVVMTAVENGQDLILEGCYLPPEELAALPEEYRREITAFWLLFSRGYVMKHYGDILAHRCDAERRLYPEERSAEQMAGEHERWAALCAEAGAKHFIIEEDDEGELEAALRRLRERLGPPRR